MVGFAAPIERGPLSHVALQCSREGAKTSTGTSGSTMTGGDNNKVCGKKMGSVTINLDDLFDPLVKPVLSPTKKHIKRTKVKVESRLGAEILVVMKMTFSQVHLTLNLTLSLN